MAPQMALHRPQLMLMKGHPGSGKSSIAREVSRQLKWPLLDKDDVRDAYQRYAMHTAPQQQQQQQQQHTIRQSKMTLGAVELSVNVEATPGTVPTANTFLAPEGSSAQCNPVELPEPVDIDWTALSYDVLFRIAAKQLSLGISAVIDCPLAHKHLYERAVELCKQHNAGIIVVRCSCSNEAVWRQRLEARGLEEAGTDSSHKPGTWEVLQATLTRYNGCWQWDEEHGALHEAAVLTIDTSTGTPAEQAITPIAAALSLQEHIMHP